MKLFSKLRRKYLAEGGLKRYLTYALGEVLIVVIGILFALQVNNYNESRKEDVFELKVLREILVGINNNIFYLNMGIDRNDDAITSCKVILNHFNNGYSYHDSLGKYFSTAQSIYFPSMDNIAYESLKSSGLHLIKNDSIRYELGAIYEWKYMDRLNIRQEEYYYQTISPILTDLFESNEFWGEMKPFDYSELRKSKKYIHILNTLIFNRELQNVYWKRSIAERQNLALMIKAELSAKSSFKTDYNIGSHVNL